MDLVIIRHARPERDERADGAGTADPPLSELGLRQADATLRARATPEDIARSIVFLATDPLISGSNLPIFCNA